MEPSLEALLREHLGDWNSGWSMGAFGAIAEFHQDEDEQPVVDEPYALMRATRRGAVRFDRTLLPDVTAVAYEIPSPKRHRWSHALALCLPDNSARRASRGVLSELGPDDHAIRGIDRTGILFDMGLSLPQCDFCIRTSDPKLLTALRANLGKSLFDHGNSAMPVILSAHPHRVALTNIGRVEVYQKIGGPDTGGVSPPGPHTHLLPKLLRSGRTHSANTPIPEGLTPLASLHPGNPVIGPMGEDRPFDPHLHRTFQNLLERFGAPGIAALKQRIRTAIERGDQPISVEAPADRFARASLRITLRQMAHETDVASMPGLKDWLLAHEGLDDLVEDDTPGH